MELDERWIHNLLYIFADIHAHKKEMLLVYTNRTLNYSKREMLDKAVYLQFLFFCSVIWTKQPILKICKIPCLSMESLES